MIEEADAWFEYLEATRGQSVVRYAELEPWAWARLNQRLRAIRARRASCGRQPRSLRTGTHPGAGPRFRTPCYCAERDV